MKSSAAQTNTIGIRRLKAELSQHLRRVQGGETIQVTDRGRVIATINPVVQLEEQRPAVQWARALVAAGKGTWSGQKLRPPTRAARLRGTATVSDAVIEDRR